jgi:triosephosphate isomerase
MVAELCQFVIIGHSERRAYFGETDETVNRKVKMALAHGLKPIVCVGETLEENEAGQTEAVVSRQMQAGLAGLDTAAGAQLTIAYEPVWAIGTGKACDTILANSIIRDVVRGALTAAFGDGVAQAIRIQYGGSVKPGNAADYFGMSDIDGALVGGASLKAEDFAAIVQAAAP